jgi:hypothetical protein
MRLRHGRRQLRAEAVLRRVEQRAQAVFEAERVRLCYGRRVTMMDGEDVAAIKVERPYALGQ